MQSITKDMYDIMRCHRRYRAGYMEQFELKSCHANYIIAVCGEPGASQEQLAARVYADKSNVARQIAALEEKGYVRREIDSMDKRIQRVYPTEKAKELLPLIRDKQAKWDSFITETLTSGELVQARAILQKMKQRADIFMEREL